MEGGPLPADATQASRVRYDLAQRLARQCPDELGREIALTGSVSRGIADQDSDIEWVAWVEKLPSAEEREAWLRQVRATDVADQGINENDAVWASCRYQGLWVEAGWQTIAGLEKLLQDIIAGSVMAHRPLEIANAVANALSVRSSGLLSKWQHALSEYPDVLQARLIAEAVQFWPFGYSYWALARRGDRLALAHRLVEDVHRVLRILFALNRGWEPSWKWIELETQRLTIKPGRLVERINQLLLVGDAERSVELCMDLVVDTLRLVPPPHDVSGALTSVQARLQARAP